jgi:hypothetical protein
VLPREAQESGAGCKAEGGMVQQDKSQQYVSTQTQGDGMRRLSFTMIAMGSITAVLVSKSLEQALTPAFLN